MIDSLREKIPARVWSYVLDFNDQDGGKLLDNKFGVKRLSELTLRDFWKLFIMAYQLDTAVYHPVSIKGENPDIEVRKVVSPLIIKEVLHPSELTVD